MQQGEEPSRGLFPSPGRRGCCRQSPRRAGGAAPESRPPVGQHVGTFLRLKPGHVRPQLLTCVCPWWRPPPPRGPPGMPGPQPEEFSLAAGNSVPAKKKRMSLCHPSGERAFPLGAEPWVGSRVPARSAGAPWPAASRRVWGEVSPPVSCPLEALVSGAFKISFSSFS